jgi:single-strand DNA-binding protein
MATTFNKIILVGHLSRDPELRVTATGTAMATFGLATNHRYKAGEAWQEETCFLDVVVFGRQAASVCDALHKGSQALVEGRVRQHTWETSDGQKRHKHEVVAERVHFLGVRTQGADATIPPEEADVGGPDEEEIPF